MMSPVKFNNRDVERMSIAIEQAKLAMSVDEVPVGACIFDEDNNLLAKSFNTNITDNDPTAHAEINCLRLAAKLKQNYRINNCVIYVTLEPCAMCVGAITHARIAKIVYGANDPKTGACGSVINIAENSQINHHTQVVGGILADECAKLLSDFFQTKR